MEIFVKAFFEFWIKYPIFLVLIIIIWSLYFLLKINYACFRGKMGEFWIKEELKKLPEDRYRIMNDIMIQDNNTHQIDHIIFSNYGIFVIETKNYYGLIIGDYYKENWCKYTNKNKYYFKNPIYQNYGHIKALSKLLQIDESYFISVVCFSNQVKLKIKNKNNKDIVTQLDLLNNEIQKFQNITNLFNINHMVNIINNANITDKKIRKQHVNDIRNKIKKEETLVNDMKCPKCGNDLIEKKGRYGKFIGCSNYPKCHYTKK